MEGKEIQSKIITFIGVISFVFLFFQIGSGSASEIVEENEVYFRKDYSGPVYNTFSYGILTSPVDLFQDTLQ
jgi:hypothetical protein